jgi:hypothetical protein
MTDAPAAPAVQQAPNPAPAPPSFDSAIKAQQTHLAQRDSRGSQPEPAKQEAPKVEAPKTESKVDPKSPWAKLDMVKTAEEQAATPDDAVEAKSDDKAAKAREKFGEYKKLALEYQEKRTKWETIEKEYESLKNQWTPERIQRYEELVAFEAAKNIENTPEYKQQIIEPYQQREAELKAAADAFKMDYGKLLDAANESNRFNRQQKIKALVKAAADENGLDYDPTVVTDIELTAREMHTLAEKAEEHRREAQERWTSIEGKKTAESEASKTQQAQEYEKAHNEVFGHLEKRGFLSNEFDFEHEGTKMSIVEAVKGAKPAEDVMGRAMQAQVAELAPFLITALNKAKSEIAELKKTQGARIAAKPNLSGHPTAAAPNGKEAMTLDQAIAAQMTRQGSRF